MPKRFIDDNDAPNLHLEHRTMDGMDKWEKGKVYVVTLRTRKVGECSHEGFPFNSSEFRVLKASGRSEDDELADRVKNRT